MISTIHPRLEAGTAGTIGLGSVVFPTRFATFPGPAVLAGRDGRYFLIWTKNGVQLEEVEPSQPLLRISEAAHLDIDERSQIYLRETEAAPQPGMIVLARGQHEPLLVVEGPSRRDLAVNMTAWTVGAMPGFFDIAFKKWSVWPSATLGRVNDHPFIEVDVA